MDDNVGRRVAESDNEGQRVITSERVTKSENE